MNALTIDLDQLRLSRLRTRGVKIFFEIRHVKKMSGQLAEALDTLLKRKSENDEETRLIMDRQGPGKADFRQVLATCESLKAELRHEFSDAKLQELRRASSFICSYGPARADLDGFTNELRQLYKHIRIRH
ncbi:MAG: hypothetical protein HGJ94_00540 [Desulfosarcina sp.]|nr:hypothetical protein [Desulfosarcina sp.]MBC2744151.1 hypothetical protein [Desulfosarcina sp.]MBC2767060.1 hypothetical protein [Desulfosarcina sp.]